MTATRHVLTALILSSLPIESAFAQTESAKQELVGEIRKVDPAYTGEKFRVIEKAYAGVLKRRDSKAWSKQVADLKDDKRRKSFLCEYFAYGGDYELQPLREFGATPVVTKKHRLRILLFRPGKPLGRNEPLSDKLKATTYLVIRTHVPFGNENPYGIYISQALRGYSTQQLKQIVEAYRVKL